MEATWHSSVIRRQRNRDRQLRLVLRRRGECDSRSLHPRNLAPVDGKEDPLLWGARRYRALRRRDLHPRGVARYCECEWGRAASADIDKAVPCGDERVDGEGRVPAAVAQSAVELVVSRPAGEGFSHRMCSVEKERAYHAPIEPSGTIRIAPASACLDGCTFVIMGILFVYDQQESIGVRRCAHTC